MVTFILILILTLSTVGFRFDPESAAILGDPGYTRGPRVHLRSPGIPQSPRAPSEQLRKCHVDGIYAAKRCIVEVMARVGPDYW